MTTACQRHKYTPPFYLISEFKEEISTSTPTPSTNFHYTASTIKYKVVVDTPAERQLLATPSISTLPFYVLCGSETKYIEKNHIYQ